MKYIGKLWLKEGYPMLSVALYLRLKNFSSFETQDLVGTMEWRGGDILVLLHLSWGEMNNVQKLKVYVHHVEETEYDEFWKLVTEKLKEIIKTEDQEKEKTFDYTIKYDGD